jgi:hypothetical protein
MDIELKDLIIKSYKTLTIILSITILILGVGLIFSLNSCIKYKEIANTISPTESIANYQLSNCSFIDTDSGLIGKYTYCRPAKDLDSADIDVKTFVEPQCISFSKKVKSRKDIPDLQLLIKY